MNISCLSAGAVTIPNHQNHNRPLHQHHHHNRDPENPIKQPIHRPPMNGIIGRQPPRRPLARQCVGWDQKNRNQSNKKYQITRVSRSAIIMITSPLANQRYWLFPAGQTIDRTDKKSRVVASGRSDFYMDVTSRSITRIWAGSDGYFHPIRLHPDNGVCRDLSGVRLRHKP